MKALVTGGGGFLGGRIVAMLDAAGHDVTALGRNAYPWLTEAGIGTLQADIRDAAAMRAACRGAEVVFHVAAVPGVWGKRRTFWEINVGGTRNVLQACQEGGVAKLVYTSSPSVVFGEEELCGVDESQPYPARYLADYPETKAVAEQAVLEANGRNLATVALRPHLIWGPGDPHLIPRVVSRAKQGKLMQVGDGKNRVDITYIDNAAEAHLNAADSLAPGAACAGRAYFISQGEPVSLWSWINELLGRLGVPLVSRTISHQTAHRVGWLAEALYRLLRLRGEPLMTRFLASQLAKSHYFDISSARRDLGYVPRVSTKEGMEILVSWLAGNDRHLTTPGGVVRPNVAGAGSSILGETG